MSEPHSWLADATLAIASALFLTGVIIAVLVTGCRSAIRKYLHQ